MSEDGNYTPAPHWKGHDFKSAYKAYDQHAGRSYAQAKASGVTASDMVPESIRTESTCPAIIDTDFTGSMSGWDATIFSKFPYLEHEMKTEYLGADVEASFGAICDTLDNYPLQISKFAGGKDLDPAIKSLVHASGGSGPGNLCEAHGLAMLYRTRNSHMPNAYGKPPYIIITDEMPYGLITVDEAKRFAKVDIEKKMTIEEIIAETMMKFSLYVIVKPYGASTISGDELADNAKMVKKRWEELIGIERIALLPDPNRVVDVIFGILAQEAGKVGYFREELEKRQLPDKDGKQKVETVYKSLKTIHMLAPPDKGGSKGHSKTQGLGGGKKTKPLM